MVKLFYIYQDVYFINIEVFWQFGGMNQKLKNGRNIAQVASSSLTSLEIVKFDITGNGNV